MAEATILLQAAYMLILSIISAVSCWFLVDLLVDERGPFDIFLKIRRLAGINVITVVDGDAIESSNGNFWADVLDCPYCTTPYVTGALVLLLLTFGLPMWQLLLIWSAACGFMYLGLDRLR